MPFSAKIMFCEQIRFFSHFFYFAWDNTNKKKTKIGGSSSIGTNETETKVWMKGITMQNNTVETSDKLQFWFKPVRIKRDAPGSARNCNVRKWRWLFPFQTKQSFLCRTQGSHSVWKTCNIELTFSSQGKLRENRYFGEFLEKSGKNNKKNYPEKSGKNGQKSLEKSGKKPGPKVGTLRT